MKNNWVATSTTDKNLNMMSLFDYLGFPAGKKLGKAVASAASESKIKLEVRHVSNKKYTGPVLLYPKYFLDSYFNKNVSKGTVNINKIKTHFTNEYRSK